MATYGYKGKILSLNLTSGTMTELPTMDYAERFIGGRGIAAKMYWDEVKPDTSALDPDNMVIFATGPLCGLPTIAGSRWTICGKIPSVERFSYGNFGGRWGAELRFAGYDAIAVKGRSENPVYLVLHDGTAKIKNADNIWGKGSIETREFLKAELGNSTKIVAIGPAGENKAVMANLIAENDASGSVGVGAALGSKNLKAIAVNGTGERVEVANPEKLREFTKYYCDLKIGFPYYGEQFHSFLSRWSRDLVKELRMIPQEMKKEPCYGCQGRCPRKMYTAENGKIGKFICHSAYFYQPWAEKFYGDWNDVPFMATKLCDENGLDTIEIDRIIGWLDVCYKAEILTEKDTEIPLSKVGSLEYIDTLIRMMSRREGFGDVLAKGLLKAAEEVGSTATEQLKHCGMLGEPDFFQPYGPRLYITNALLYAMEPRMPINMLHSVGLLVAKWVTWTLGLGYLSSDTVRAIAERFWGSELAADLSTYNGKALAAKKIQDNEYAKECLILCDWLWPVMELESTEDHVGDPTLESKLLSAVIGGDLDEHGLEKIGERVFNLHRALHIREGHRGREFDALPDRCYTAPLDYDFSNPDCLVPGKDGEMTSLKGARVNKDEFERMKDEYYEIRHWDVATGLQTESNLADLELPDVAKELKEQGLLASAN